MDILYVPSPVSVGLLLSYKCNMECRDCIYACSPKYRGDWISEDDDITRDRLTKLKEAGLDGILISINPFNVESIPFERTERAVRISREVFGANIIVYQKFYLDLFKKMGLQKTLSFEKFLNMINPTYVYRYTELLPMGRTPYKLGYLYNKCPAKYFFEESCKEELTRNWHTHIDNYRNYISGFCSGISLGDAMNMDSIFNGIDLSKKPILKALSVNLGNLHKIAVSYGYEINEEGYISKCHLCVDMRKYIIEKTDQFTELNPRTYYLNL
ncbi:MAG: hypothetical protein M1371_06235 [Actinobacteria bacterium]|nr:hypothetical protein [Actinomycetota bacterium]